MNNTPTPETDAEAITPSGFEDDEVSVKFARKQLPPSRHRKERQTRMKDQDQIKALAELDGWKPCHKHDNLGFPPQLNPNRDCPQCYKPYLTSYDAIIPLIQKQSQEVKSKVSVMIGLKHDWSAWLSKTPSQLCEALLRATGKWKE